MVTVWEGGGRAGERAAEGSLMEQRRTWPMDKEGNQRSHEDVMRIIIETILIIKVRH